MKRFLAFLFLCCLPAGATPIDLTYEQAVQLAVKQNLELKAASFEVPIADAETDEAEAARNPTLANNFVYLNQSPSLERQLESQTRFLLIASGYTVGQATLYTLGQNQMLDRTALFIPIYTGGRLESTIHVQAALAQAARAGLARATQTLVYATKLQYLSTLLARENISVAKEVLERAHEISTYAQSRLKAGVGTKYDVLQADVAVAQAEDAQVTARSSWEKAGSDLASILDLPVLTEFTLVGEVEESVASRDLKQLAETALGQRPELEQLRHRLVANHERENVARSAQLPQLGLQLNYDLIGNPNRLGTGFSMIATLSIPIFDGGVSSAQIDQFQIRDLQLKTEEKKLIQDITLEVNKDLLDLDEADSRLTTAQAAESAAREALRISTLRYQVGAGTSLELVTAQTVLSNAEFALAAARYRQLEARVALNYAVGTKS